MARPAAQDCPMTTLPTAPNPSGTAATLPALPPPALPGQPLRAVDTPALVLDLDAFARNLERMQSACDRAGVQLRPHAKAHKCPDIALAQVARGAVGICCQKVSEALPFVAAGIRDIHVSNQVVGESKLALLAALARHAHLSVCVDDARQVEALAEACATAGSRLSVLVEIDIGQGRCGVADGTAALRLVEAIDRHPQLVFRGLQAYHGGIQHLRGHGERREAAARAAQRTAAALRILQGAGVRSEVVTGGGTGSVEFDLASGVYTELQPGSYVFMDADYGRNQGAAAADGLRFEHSLFLAATVMSVAAASRAEPRVIVDAGLKSVATDSGLPLPWRDGARDGRLDYLAANDEHGIVAPAAGAGADALPALGEQMLLVPGHCDPTLNLYETLVTVRGGTVAGLWPVAARGHSR